MFPESTLTRLILISTLLAAADLSYPSLSALGESNVQSIDVPADMRWEPRWREKGDCGPVSLYVLMRLLGESITLDEAKAVVQFDAIRGCSMQAVVQGADQLGFDCEIRFVEPENLQQINGPFILHQFASLEKGTGHFIPVITHSKDRKDFAVIDVDLAVR